MSAPPQPFNVTLTGQDQADIKPKKPAGITDKDLNTLVETLAATKTISNLNLDLKSCKGLTDTGIAKIKEIIAQSGPLKRLRLNLTDCEKISDDSIEPVLEAISQHPSLEDLSLILEGCSKVKGAALLPILKALKPLVHLTSLELTPPKVSDNLMEEFQFTVSKLERLTTLNLRFGAKDKKEGSLSDKGFSELAKTIESLPHLEHLYLDLFRGDWNITDESVVNLAAAIFKQKNLFSLRLNLRGIDFIQEIGVGHLCEAITKLKKLRKLHLNFKTDNEENIFALKMPLSVLLELRQLHLDFSWGVTDATLEELANSFVNLEHLSQLHINFSGCRDITNQGIAVLKEIIMALPSLNDLRLEFPWCYSVTNYGLADLAEAIGSVPSLTQLALNFERGKQEDEEEEGEPINAGIAEIFRAIGDQANIKMLNLNFSNCLSLTDEDIGVLAESLETLEHLTSLMLDVKLCDKLSDTGISYLREGLKDLPLLNNVLLNFLWCDKISEKGILKLLELKKAKKIPQFSIAYRKDEAPAQEGGCNMF